MHVALLTSTAYLDEQLRVFNQLVVGLIDEGERVVQIIPDHVSEESTTLFGQRLNWTPSDWAWTNTRRLQRVASVLAELDISLLHVFDADLWHPASRIAQMLDVPLVMAVHCEEDMDSVRLLLRHTPQLRLALTGASRPLTDALRESLPDHVLVRMVRPGVHLTGERDPSSIPGDAACLVVTGDGEIDADYQQLLRALVQVVQACPQVQIFFDGQNMDQHEIWKLGRTLGLLSHMSLVPRQLGHREILLRADLLIQPQALGQIRPLTPQAMAHGVPVIARADPWLDYLVDAVTARVLEDPDSEQWAAGIINMIQQREETEALARSAHTYVREHQAVPVQVSRTLNVYRQLAADDLPFPSPAT